VFVKADQTEKARTVENYLAKGVGWKEGGVPRSDHLEKTLELGEHF